MRRLLVVCSMLVLGPAGSAGAQVTPSGSFAQLAGRAGCVQALGWLRESEEDDLGCASAGGLFGPRALAVTPDGRQLVAATDGSDALVVLDRAADTGALTFASCVSDGGGDGRLGSDGRCGDGDGLAGAGSVALTPDGRWLYATGADAGALTWFERDTTTGALTQRGCLRAFTWPGERCRTAPLFGGASAVAVSPDGAVVLVASASAASLQVFRRDAAGGLAQVACARDSGSEGVCVNADGLRGASAVTVSADGRRVYVVAPAAGAVTAFTLDPGTGALAQTACVAEVVAARGACDAVPTLGGAASAVLGPEGRGLYVGAADDEALTVFAAAASGTLAPRECFRFESGEEAGDPVEEPDDEDATEAARAAQDGTKDCTPVRSMVPEQVAVSADGRAVFTAGSDYVSAFRRDPADGTLTWMACAEQARTYEACVPARGTPDSVALAASADGRNLYVASDGTASIAVFAASVAVDRRAGLDRRRGVARVTVRCPPAHGAACRGHVRDARRAVHGTSYRVRAGAAVTVRVRLAGRHPARRRQATVVATDVARRALARRQAVALR